MSQTCGNSIDSSRKRQEAERGLLGGAVELIEIVDGPEGKLEVQGRVPLDFGRGGRLPVRPRARLGEIEIFEVVDVFDNGFAYQCGLARCTPRPLVRQLPTVAEAWDAWGSLPPGSCPGQTTICPTIRPRPRRISCLCRDAP